MGSSRLWVAQKYHFFRDLCHETGLFEQLLKGQADMIGAAGFQLEVFFRQALESLGLTGIEIVRIHQP